MPRAAGRRAARRAAARRGRRRRRRAVPPRRWRRRRSPRRSRACPAGRRRAAAGAAAPASSGLRSSTSLVLVTATSAGTRGGVAEHEAPGRRCPRRRGPARTAGPRAARPRPSTRAQWPGWRAGEQADEPGREDPFQRRLDVVGADLAQSGAHAPASDSLDVPGGDGLGQVGVRQVRVEPDLAEPGDERGPVLPQRGVVGDDRRAEAVAVGKPVDVQPVPVTQDVEELVDPQRPRVEGPRWLSASEQGRAAAAPQAGGCRG